MKGIISQLYILFFQRNRYNIKCCSKFYLLSRDLEALLLLSISFSIFP